MISECHNALCVVRLAARTSIALRYAKTVGPIKDRRLAPRRADAETARILVIDVSRAFAKLEPLARDLIVRLGIEGQSAYHAGRAHDLSPKQVERRYRSALESLALQLIRYDLL